MRIRDREWQESVIRLIRKARVPILPIRFFDGNSPFFYFLGLIDWRIRVLRQPSELFNKAGKKHRVGIGKIIPVEEQDQYVDHKSFGIFLRKSVYEMPLSGSFIRRSLINFPGPELNTDALK
jgi:putative hemolysin